MDKYFLCVDWADDKAEIAAVFLIEIADGHVAIIDSVVGSVEEVENMIAEHPEAIRI